MKPRFLLALLAAALVASAAESTQPPGFYELATRWAARPLSEIEAEAERGDASPSFISAAPA